jgi:hypothetical protein
MCIILFRTKREIDHEEFCRIVHEQTAKNRETADCVRRMLATSCVKFIEAKDAPNDSNSNKTIQRDICKSWMCLRILARLCHGHLLPARRWQLKILLLRLFPKSLVVIFTKQRQRHKNITRSNMAYM